MALIPAALLILQSATSSAVETAPDAEKLALATEVAAASPLATIGPLQTAAEVENIIAAHPELTADEADRVRALGKQRADELGQQALATEAAALADALTVEDLRAIAAFQRSTAAANHRAALPQVAMAVMQSLDGLDFRGEVQAAYCAESGKLCDVEE